MTSPKNMARKASVCQASGTAYRADIDGLRAVAVLLVVLYHLGFRFVGGGFIGVDIFFVISGYLISGIIISESEAGNFSIGRFYERRIRRIVPALLVVMIPVCGLAYLHLLPAEMKQFAQSLICTTLSTSNIFFWRKAGYFDSSSEFQPLLHTWSLAVEEQFYLFFPLLIILLYRLAPKKIRATVLLLALTSLAISTVQVVKSPTSAFYLPFGRAWELLMGTIVYLRVFPTLSTSWQRNLSASIGALMICIAAFGFSNKTPFPGVAALLPCVGTALIIAAGLEGTSFVRKVLSIKPAVAIGLISYSFYLWHWPILVFQRLGTIIVQRGSVREIQIAVFSVSILLAYLSWRFVEKPFRASRPTLPRVIVFRLAGMCMVSVVFFSIVILAEHGIPSRYPREAVRVAEYLDYDTTDPYRTGKCFIPLRDEASKFDPSICLREKSNKRNVLLIGDSHAAQLWSGLTSVFPDINFLQATAAGCEPTLEQRRRSNANCVHLMAEMYSDFVDKQNVDEVLVAARWESLDLPRIRSTLLWMKSRGVKVILFGPIIQYDTSLPRLLARSIQLHDPEIPDKHRLAEFEALDHDMEAMSADLKVPYISFFKTLCSGGHCVQYAQDLPLQSDRSHMTKEGSILFARRLQQSDGINF